MTAPDDGTPVSRADSDRGRKTTKVSGPDEARASEVVLKDKRRRTIFFAAIVGAILFATVLALAIY
jgi:hypothetical protein